MGRATDRLTPAHRDFIARQRMFIVAKAIRKLQHPVRARKLEGFLNGSGHE